MKIDDVSPTKNQDLLETAVKSGDMNHRNTAAWAFGLQAIPDATSGIASISVEHKR
jgi:hypothetical protein